MHAHDVANKSLEKKIFHRVENVIKQLVHTSSVRSSRYEALGKFGEHSNLFVTVLFIKLQNIFVTVLYSYKKYCRIVRFSYVNGMMHGLDGLSISLMHNNFLITYLLLLFL